ncbi:MAG: glutamate--cysteine ligase, partial [Planctomycetota bacterium]
EFYSTNCNRVPSVAGAVIPEPVYTRRAYETEILQRMYDDVAPLDPEGVLRHDWLNARGAIARFDRGSLEIRVLDAQECPRADLAVCAATAALVEALVEERWIPFPEQKAWPVAPLHELFGATVRDAEAARFPGPGYPSCFGAPDAATAGELWSHLVDELLPAPSPWREALSVIVRHGTLARRIRRAAGAKPGPGRLYEVYGELCDCLEQGRLFAA